jgi:hypothetical protein
MRIYRKNRRKRNCSLQKFSDMMKNNRRKGVTDDV